MFGNCLEPDSPVKTSLQVQSLCTCENKYNSLTQEVLCVMEGLDIITNACFAHLQ